MLHLVGWMNENHTMHIQSDSLTFGRRHIFSACLGFCFCCLQSFSSCLRLSHRERKVSWLVGAEIRSLLFELWFGNNRRRASERSLYCRLYHMSGRFWDTGSCFCGFAISYLLSLSFSFLHRFSLTTGPLDHAGVGFGLRKNTSSSTSIFDLVPVVMCWCCWYMMNPTSCTATAMGPCIAASIRLSLSRLRFYRIEACLPTSIWTAQSAGTEISISTGSQTDKSIIEPLKA